MTAVNLSSAASRSFRFAIATLSCRAFCAAASAASAAATAARASRSASRSAGVSRASLTLAPPPIASSRAPARPLSMKKANSAGSPASFAARAPTP